MNSTLDRTDCFDANNYEFNPESKTGIMLIHGFSSTTYELKKLAVFLADNNIFVRLENLPGHGTTVKDCNRYKYIDWINFVEQDLAEMSSKCDKLYLVGISMGSALALHLCSVFPINAAVFAATVLMFNSLQALRILKAISPLLAINTFENIFTQ